MPPKTPSKRKPIRAAIVTDDAQPQDYKDPFRKFTLNPEPTLQETIATAANKATGKPQIAKPRNPRTKLTRKLATVTQPEFGYSEAVAQQRVTDETTATMELLNARVAEANQREEIEREARLFEEVTRVPDLALSATGGITPGSGVVASTLLRSGLQGLQGNLGIIGQTLTDAFDFEDTPEILKQLGPALKNISDESAGTFQQYDAARPPQSRSLTERTVGFITELGIQLPQMALAAELLGPAAGFGAFKVQGLRAAGEQDPTALAGAFIQGAAEGMLLAKLGKTAAVLDAVENPGAVVKLLQKAPRVTQAGAQFLGGVTQTAVDGMLHPGQPTPDAFDYLAGGVANVIMDPVVLGGSGKARKATQAATKSAREADPSSYNLTLPEDNLTKLRQDFWQPMDLPWDNQVTEVLLNRARVQLIDSPTDPEGVLYVNPQAVAVLDRAVQAVVPGAQLLKSAANGLALNTGTAQAIARHLFEKSQQLQRAIEQLPDGDPQLQQLATGAVVYEGLAEHLQAATAGGRPLAVRLFDRPQQGSSWDPNAKKFDQTVVGHESQHNQQHKLARAAGVAEADYRKVVAPGWLLEHPLGVKAIAAMDLPDSVLKGYAPDQWLPELIAFAAQPGPDPGIGLTKQERGILVGDYLAEVIRKHGPAVMQEYYAGRMDREVAQVAFKRLYESNRVRFTRDVNGRRVGLEWRGVEPPRLGERLPDNDWGMEYQPGVGEGIPLSKQLQPEDREPLAPTWYSSLERFITSKMPEAMPAKQLLGMVKNGQLRPGELEWTGITDWLEEQGSRKVSRTEVMQELEGRRVEVQEVWKDTHATVMEREKERFQQARWDWEQRQQDLADRNAQLANEQSTFFERYGYGNYTEQQRAEYEGFFDRAQALANEQRRLAGQEPKFETWKVRGETKYDDYVQPGENENYRELLLTLPEKEQDRDAKNYAEARITENASRISEIVGGRRLDELPEEAYSEVMRLTDENTELANARRSQANTYRSGHWAEPNILAHVRMTDRTDANGEKVLFIEEVQSDWHQAGAKVGYLGRDSQAVKRDALSAELDQVRNELGQLTTQLIDNDAMSLTNETLPSLKDQAELLRGYLTSDTDAATRDSINTQLANIATAIRAKELTQRRNELHTRIANYVEQVPDAPFKKTWPELAMRRMIRYAAENGYDRVAWVGGEQADRSVGGNSSWFYDRNLPNDTNKVLKKWGVKVENVSNNPKLAEYRALDAEYKQLKNLNTAEFYANPDNIGRLDYVEKRRAELKKLLTGPQYEHSFQITQSMRDAVLHLGQAIPLNIQPDPTVNAANPGTAAGDSAAVDIDPDVTHLTKANASPEVRKQVADQKLAERNAARELRKLTARIKNNKDLKLYAEQMIAESGILQPELMDEITQTGEQLKQQYKDGLDKFRQLRAAGNQLKQQLAGQLSDNVQRIREEATAEAKHNIEQGIPLPKDTDPVTQVTMSQQYLDYLADVSKNLLIASGVPILPGKERMIHDQLLDAIKTGQAQVPELNEAAKRMGLKDVFQLFESFDEAAAVHGRGLNTFGRAAKELYKLRGVAPELDEWLNSRPPSAAELDSIANTPGIMRQLIGLRIGAMVANASTQAVNVLTGIANVQARVLINTFDQALESAVRSHSNVADEGEPAKFEQNSVPPLSTVVSPLLELWRTAKDLKDNRYWFAHGKLEDGGASGTKPTERSVRMVQDLHPAFPELMRKFDSALVDEPIRLDLLPHAETIQAQQDAVTLLKRQIASMPEGAEKKDLLRSAEAAEKRIAKSNRWLPKVLHEAARGLHWYLTPARIGERFVRTASLISVLDREATRRGLDLEDLDRKGELHKLPAEVVETAVNEALRDTYALRPDPNSTAGRLYQEYAHSENPGWIAAAAAFPFVGFVGNSAKAFIDHSPLALGKLLKAENRDLKSAANRDWIIRATLGSALYVAFLAAAEEKYDDAEATGEPVKPWHNIGGISVRNIPQLAPAAFIADYAQRVKRGLKTPDGEKALDFFNIMAGIDARNLTGTFDWLDGLVKTAQDSSGTKGQRTAEAAARAVSEWWAGYLTPLNTYTDVAAQWYKDQRKVKEMYGLGATTLFAPVLNKIPVAREVLPDKIDPFTGMPLSRTDYPALKGLTGFTILPPQTYPARIFQHAGIKLVDWIPFTGIADVDRSLVATIGKLAAERNDLLEQALSGQDLDQQIALTYKAMTEVAKEAEQQTKAKFPGVYQRLQDSRQQNEWERRVEDKFRQLQGIPGRHEIYQQMNDAAKEVREQLP